jgi:hypothetical protein
MPELSDNVRPVSSMLTGLLSWERTDENLC